jgi:hypothetical protein
MGDMIDKARVLEIITAARGISQKTVDAIAALPPAPDAVEALTGLMLHEIFVRRMAYAYVDEDPIELKGVCMDGYFNLVQIAEDINAALAAIRGGAK